MFQFLIGNLKTYTTSGKKIDWVEFQFLIGNLKTYQIKHTSACPKLQYSGKSLEEFQKTNLMLLINCRRKNRRPPVIFTLFRVDDIKFNTVLKHF